MGTADAVLLIFTLAALAPAQMPAMLQAAFQVRRSLPIDSGHMFDLAVALRLQCSSCVA